MGKYLALCLVIGFLCVGGVASVSVHRALKDVQAFIDGEIGNPSQVADKRSDDLEDIFLTGDKDGRILVGNSNKNENIFREPSDRPDKIKVTIFKEYKVQEPSDGYVSIQEQGGDFKGSLNPPPVQEFIQKHTEQFEENVGKVEESIQNLDPYELVPAITPQIPAFQQQLLQSSFVPNDPPKIRFPEQKQEQQQEQHQGVVDFVDPIFEKYRRKTMDGWTPIKGGLSSFYKDSLRGKGSFSPVKNVDFPLEGSGSNPQVVAVEPPVFQLFTQNEVMRPGVVTPPVQQVIKTQVKNLVIDPNNQRLGQRFPIYQPGTPMKVEIHAHNVILNSDQNLPSGQSSNSGGKSPNVSQIKAYEATPQVTATIREQFRLSKGQSIVPFPTGGLSLRSVAQALRNGAFSRENDVVPQSAERELQITIPHTFKIRNPSVEGGYSTVSTQGLAALAQNQDSVSHQSINTPTKLAVPNEWQQNGQVQSGGYDNGPANGGFNGGQSAGGYNGGQSNGGYNGGQSAGGYGGGQTSSQTGPTPQSPKHADYGDSVKYVDKSPVQIIDAQPVSPGSSQTTTKAQSGSYGAPSGNSGDRKRLITELQQKLNRLIEEQLSKESSSQYGPPSSQQSVGLYGPPSQSAGSYGPPSGSPADSYGPPGGSSGSLADSYGPPGGSSGSPADSYGPPEGSSGSPSDAYGPPTGSHGSPGEPYGPPESYSDGGGYENGGSGGISIDFDSDSYGMKYHLSPPSDDEHHVVEHHHDHGHHSEEHHPLVEIADHGPSPKESLVKLGKNLFYTALDFSRKYNPITFIEKVKEFPPIRFEVNGAPAKGHHGHDHHEGKGGHKKRSDSKRS